MNILLLAALLAIPVVAQEFQAECRTIKTLLDASRRRLRETGAASHCPSMESLSRPWIEHRGSIPAAVHVAHLSSPLDDATVALVPIQGTSRWIGTSRRGRGMEPAEPGCFVLGSAALYANGPEDSPPLDFVATINAGSEASLGRSLVELRWYDPKDGRKHRWIKPAWPIPLPQTINELLNRSPL